MGSTSHYTTPLVINSLGADTHTRKHTHIHTHTHTHTHLRQSNTKKPGAPGLKIGISGIKSQITRDHKIL